MLSKLLSPEDAGAKPLRFLEPFPILQLRLSPPQTIWQTFPTPGLASCSVLIFHFILKGACLGALKDCPLLMNLVLLTAPFFSPFSYTDLLLHQSVCL